MKPRIHPRQVRAARALLAMSQEALAAEAEIGLATVKRFESGRTVRDGIERALRSALERRGAVIIEAASSIGSIKVGAGVAVREEAYEESLREEGGDVTLGGRRRTRSV